MRFQRRDGIEFIGSKNLEVKPQRRPTIGNGIFLRVPLAYNDALDPEWIGDKPVGKSLNNNSHLIQHYISLPFREP